MMDRMLCRRAGYILESQRGRVGKGDVALRAYPIPFVVLPPCVQSVHVT